MKVSKKEMDKLMLEYKKTNREDLLGTILNKMKGIIIQQVSQKIKDDRFSILDDKEDFEAMSMEFIWRGIKDYKFVCPVCGKMAKNEKAYLKHMKEKHSCGSILNGKMVKTALPFSSIFLYVINGLEKRLLNQLSSEKKIKRIANSYSVRESDDEQTGVSPLNTVADKVDLEDMVITNGIINDMMDKLKSEKKLLHQFILEGIVKRGFSKTAIAEALFKSNKYKSIESAKTMVSKTIKEIRVLYTEIAC